MGDEVQIVLPVCDGLPYVHEAVASVRAQTHSNWRLHLVDDASTDGSRAALDGYRGPRVEVTHNEVNLGLYGSLAQKVRHLPPAWVVFLMQDDRLKPTHLAEMLALARSHPNGRAFWAAVDLVDEGGRRTAAGLNTGRVEVIESGPAAWRDGLRRGCFWTISGSFTDGDLLRELPFAAEYPHCGDYDWLLRALLRARLVYYERPLTDIRFHDRQASTRHLRRGQDVREDYAIVRHNCRGHAGWLDRRALLRVCRPRAWRALRRSAGALVRGRPMHAARLAAFAGRFALLPLTQPPGGSPRRDTTSAVVVEETA